VIETYTLWGLHIVYPYFPHAHGPPLLSKWGGGDRAMGWQVGPIGPTEYEPRPTEYQPRPTEYFVKYVWSEKQMSFVKKKFLH
jgi:hypothetical protein